MAAKPQIGSTETGTMSNTTNRQSITEFMESSWSGDAELEGLDAVIQAIADGELTGTTPGQVLRDFDA